MAADARQHFLGAGEETSRRIREVLLRQSFARLRLKRDAPAALIDRHVQLSWRRVYVVSTQNQMGDHYVSKPELDVRYHPSGCGRAIETCGQIECPEPTAHSWCSRRAALADFSMLGVWRPFQLEQLPTLDREAFYTDADGQSA